MAAPAAPAGVVAVMLVLSTTTFVAAVPPKVTVAPVAKFVPVIVTAVPPAVEPLLGSTLLTVGTTGAAPTPINGTITPNQARLPVKVAVAVWIPVAVTAFASEANVGLTAGATVIPVYPAPALTLNRQQGAEIAANIRSFALTVDPLVVIVAVVPPVEFPACPKLSTFSKQALIGEQDAAKDPAFHSMIFNNNGTLETLAVAVKDVTPDGMLGQYQT